MGMFFFREPVDSVTYCTDNVTASFLTVHLKVSIHPASRAWQRHQLAGIFWASGVRLGWGN